VLTQPFELGLGELDGVIGERLERLTAANVAGSAPPPGRAIFSAPAAL
jgi:hypothetical protein